MKRLVALLAVVTAIGMFTIHSAQAGWGRGGYGPGWCDGSCYGDNLSEEQLKARDDFFAGTKNLREKLFDKRSDYADMMRSENPDKTKAADLWSEIFDLQTELQDKAAAAGLGPRADAGKGYGRGDCGGPGCGYGPRGGYGRGDCGGPGCGKGPRGGYGRGCNGPRW